MFPARERLGAEHHDGKDVPWGPALTVGPNRKENEMSRKANEVKEMETAVRSPRSSLINLVAGALTLGLVFAGGADAKTLCLSDLSESSHLVFSSVKIPRRAGQATALQGVYVHDFTATSSVVVGALIRGGDDTLRAAVHRHGPTASQLDFTMSWVADDNL